jgi:hypothetical protein
VSDPSDAGNGVRISNAQIFAEVRVLGTKVDALSGQNEEGTRVHRDHEARLRALETFRWKAAGALALVILFVSAFGYYIAQAVVHR